MLVIVGDALFETLFKLAYGRMVSSECQRSFRSLDDFPTVDVILTMDAAFELERFLQSNRSVCFGVRQLGRVGYVDQGVVLDDGSIAFLGAEQRAGLSLALDDVVLDRNRFEIAAAVESKQPFVSRGGGRSGDDMIVADFEMIEDFVDPDHAPTWVADQIVVKTSRSLGIDIPKCSNEIPVIVFWVEIETIVIDLHPIANKLDRVAIPHPVVMDVECTTTLGYDPSRILGDGDGPNANVVVDLVVFVVLEWELH